VARAVGHAVGLASAETVGDAGSNCGLAALALYTLTTAGSGAISSSSLHIVWMFLGDDLNCFRSSSDAPHVRGMALAHRECTVQPQSEHCTASCRPLSTSGQAAHLISAFPLPC
jgi:hypothetical protein